MELTPPPTPERRIAPSVARHHQRPQPCPTCHAPTCNPVAPNQLSTGCCNADEGIVPSSGLKQAPTLSHSPDRPIIDLAEGSDILSTQPLARSFSTSSVGQEAQPWTTLGLVLWLRDCLVSGFNRLFRFNSLVEDDEAYSLPTTRNFSEVALNSPYELSLAGSEATSSRSRRSQSLGRLSVTLTLPLQSSGPHDSSPPPPTPIRFVLQENENHLLQSAMQQDALITVVNRTQHLYIPANLLHYLENKPRSRGGYGEVWYGLLKEPNGSRLVAIKRIHRRPEDGSSNCGLLKGLLKEVEPWYRLNHPNISRFMAYTIDNDHAALVSEWQHYGDIMNFLRKRPDANRLELIVQAAEGLAYLHERNPPLIHGDIKPENVLVSLEGIIKFTDFGSSYQHLASDLRIAQPFRGTLRYADPVLLGENSWPTTSTDLWAFAWLIFGILTGRRPYNHAEREAQVQLAIMKRELPSRSDLPNLEHGDIIWSILEANWSPSNSRRLPASCIADRIRRAIYPSASLLTPRSESGTKWRHVELVVGR